MNNRKRITGICEKIEVHSDGTAILGCRGAEGQPITKCNNASTYRDCSLPLGEQLCSRMVASHEPHMNDAYKQTYVKVCHNLDETLSDPFKAGSRKNLQIRFEAMDRELNSMIDSSELSSGDSGRYLYHIDARILHAYLPAFWYRAEHGIDAPMPVDIINDAYKKIANILDDFSSLYEDVAMQVALRRTEVEILALLLRAKKDEFFAFPTTFREDASETRQYNHDAYTINEGSKTAIQVTNTDYKMRQGLKKSESYSPETVVAIHQAVVNLDYTGGETMITHVSDKPQEIEHEHDIVDYPYMEFDEQERYIAWGAGASHDEGKDDFRGEYIQVIGGEKRDGLVEAIIKEAYAERLEPEERNLLNGASHYLMALIREKQS